MIVASGRPRQIKEILNEKLHFLCSGMSRLYHMVLQMLHALRYLQFSLLSLFLNISVNFPSVLLIKIFRHLLYFFLYIILHRSHAQIFARFLKLYFCKKIREIYFRRARIIFLLYLFFVI